MDRADGNVVLDSYEHILPYVENGSLIGTIQNEQFYPVMPPTGSKMSDCRVDLMKKWIEEGAF